MAAEHALCLTACYEHDDDGQAARLEMAVGMPGSTSDQQPDFCSQSATVTNNP
jgi:hypothetical protein